MSRHDQALPDQSPVITADAGAATAGDPGLSRRALFTALTTATPLALGACSGGSSTSTSGGGGTVITPPSVPAAPPTATQAARFLSQSAIGYSKADITALTSSSLTAWLDTQFAMPRRQSFWDFLVANGYNVPANATTTTGFEPMVWAQLMGFPDVLRQRVGLALLNHWVVGIDGFGGNWRQFAVAAYMDILWNNAFGNFRDIMEGVSTNAAMGMFLTFLGNRKANAATGAIPDENYARELMQLFTIGLVKLNMDGTPVLSGGEPVPTYGVNDVSQAARVWTGYVFANNDATTPDRMRLPMIVDATRHETGASSFLGIDIPAGNTGDSSRKAALDGLFNHSNTPPFVTRRLIQHLVTSNPSPAYVNRVANAFVNNGSGVRGDMKAVIRAILMDPEARDDSQTNSVSFGKLREPVVRLVQWARAFNVTSPTNLWPFGVTSSPATRLAQSPGRAPSVFNWFRPGYTPPGTAIASKSLVAPEFQITSEPSVVAYVNYMQSLIPAGTGEARPDYGTLTPLATDSQALLDELNLVLAASQISPATIAQMKAALDTMPTTTTAGINNRIYAAILLVMAAPEYIVMR